MTLKRVWIASPNYSSRAGSGVRLVVVHTAEGARTYQELGNFFASSSSGVSSHTGIDDTPARIGEYVRRGDKAWTAANANPYSIQTELCGFASWSPGTWSAHPHMLENVAEWIAEECRHFGIPVRKISEAQARAGERGVCGHVDLGYAGNDHTDPGPNFPWSRVIDMAKHGAPDAAPPEPEPARAPLGVLGATIGADMAPPEYVLNDVANGSRKLGVYPSGLVRRMAGPEFQYCRDELGVPVLEFNDGDEGERYYQYDQALRGQVKERK